MARKYIPLCLAALLMLGIAVFAYLRRADIAILDPQGPVGLQERWVIVATILLCAIVVIPVFVMLFSFAWRYRADGPRAEVAHRPDWDHDSVFAELFWWVVPLAIVTVLSFIAWRSSHALDPFKPLGGGKPITIDVVALDWKWLFIYPAQHIATVNMVEFPVDTPVRFRLTSDAPMNSFWIPSLGGQIMVMPGMSTELNLMATSIGSFHGFSANISGRGFSGMAFAAKSVSSGDFQAWVGSVERVSRPLTPEAYAALAAPSAYNPVVYYSPANGSLYTGVIMRYLLPGSGVPMDMAGQGVTASSTAGSMPMGTSSMP